MATLNASLILAQQPYKAPNLDMSGTFVDIAKMKAYQQAARLEELKYGQTERAMARDEEFAALASQLFTPASQPAGVPPPRGLAGGPPPMQGGPPPPGPSLAGQTLPPAPGQNFAMAAPGITQMPDAAQAGYQRAPSALQSLATATAPMGGGMPGMPGIPAPTSMEPGTSGGGGFTEAPPGAPAPRGLAGAPPGTPAPPEAPAGLGGAQPGAPRSLLQPLNEQVLMRLYAVDPVKAGKLFESHIGMQEKKLEQTEKTNSQIYQVLSALQASPNPAAMYPRALESLRERGIPIPASFPKEYDPALIAFKLKEHETLKNQIDLSTIELNKQKAVREQLEGGKARAEAGRVPTQQRADEALIAQREAETGQTLEETTNLVNERQAKLGQVTPYTTDSTKNVYLSQAAQELNHPPGTPPTAAVIERARQYEVEDQQKVVRKTGLDAAQKVLPEADAKRVQALSDKGMAAEGLQNTLDEVERLIAEGVYTNIPEERLKQILADAGLRANDPMAARTARLHELGHALAIEQAGGKLGGQVSDTDLKAIQAAGGNFQAMKSALSMQETIKSMRRIAKIHLDDANSGWKRYKETNTLPAFGQARKERLKLLSESDLQEAMAANKWTREQAIANAGRGGYRVED